MSKQWRPAWVAPLLRAAPLPLRMDSEQMVHEDLKLIAKTMRDLGAEWVHERTVTNDDGRDTKIGRWMKQGIRGKFSVEAETKGETDAERDASARVLFRIHNAFLPHNTFHHVILFTFDNTFYIS